ncbi:MAG: tetratricopeptide repeat protein [Prevotella sp.]|nr:tetratricopeptide repeat protein [Prevotella sp.]
MKRLIVWLFVSVSVVGAWAQDVESALAKFDKQPVAATANAFFDALLKEEFIDEKTTFPASATADSLRQQVWFWAAEWLYDQGKYKEAEQYALDALKKYHPSNPERADCLNTLGCIYVRLSDFKQAANYSRQSVEVDLKGGDDDRISSSMNTLAGILMAGYQAKEAEPVILQALEHANKVDNPGRKAILLGMASEIYHTLGDDSKALPYAEEAIKIEEQLGRKPKLTIRLSQKGSALLGLHRYQEAETLYRQIIPDLKEMGDYHSYAIALNRLGMSLLCQKRQAEAIPYYKEAAGLFSKMGDLYNEIHAHRGLYESYWDINPDSAKIELDYFDLLKDSLYTHATADALSRYNAEFGNDQLMQENQEVRSAHKRTIIIAIVALLLVVLASWLIIRRMRQRERERIEALMKEIELLKVETRHEDEQREEDIAEADSSEVSVESPDRLFLKRVIEVVNEGLADKQWSVEVVASKLNMSVQTFRRRLMSAAGESPKAFISAIQMEKAGKLLTEQTDMPIVDVAFKCGFDEASSFTHTFKRIYGITPTQYRENQK